MSGFDFGYGAYLLVLMGGVASFLSPCVLPLVPGYLGFIAGRSAEQAEHETGETTAERGVFVGAVLFVLGFSTVFVALGAGATLAGAALVEYRDVLSRIAGVVIVFFGLHYVGVLKIGFFVREWRWHPAGLSARPGAWLAGCYVLGLAFALGWTPCIGPILGSILALTASRGGGGGEGVALLAVYALGLGIPFLLAAAGMEKFVGVSRRLRRHLPMVERIAGIILILTGIVIFTNSMGSFALPLAVWFPRLGLLG